MGAATTDLQRRWSGILPADLAAASTPGEIINGHLLITVKSAAIAQQLAFLSERICDKTGATRLRFRVSRVASYRCKCGAALRGTGIPAPVVEAFLEEHRGAEHQMLQRGQRARSVKDDE